MIASVENPPLSTNVGFRSRKLDAEYQAFVFALRRALEYFAAAVGAYSNGTVDESRTSYGRLTVQTRSTAVQSRRQSSSPA